MTTPAIARRRPAYRACTIVARNYLAQARVLVRSLQEHHPELDFYTLVIDGEDSDRATTGVGTVVLADEIGVPPAELHSMMVMYDVMEFATAVKPAMLMWLLRRGSQAVAYFDPDIRVFSRLDEVFATAAESDIFLTPHALEQVPRDGLHLNEQTIMQAGIYNLGFIAVGAGGYRFLTWWHDRLRTDAIVSVGEGLFTDQKWIDWVPSLFRCVITRNRGLNAAYWNLHEREVNRRDGRWFAGAHPLGFFHFSGYDPETPWLLSKHMGEQPRILLSEHPELGRLCDDYGRELIESGHPELRRLPYRLTNLPNGSHLEPVLRRVYRDVLIGRLKVDVPPPDPMTDSDAFVDWMTQPVFGGGDYRFSIAEYGVWTTREDLRSRFPDVLGRHGSEYRQWLLSNTEATNRQLRLVQRPLRPASRLHVVRNSEGRPSGFGWSVVAYARSELGVGEAGRRMAAAVSLSGFANELVSVPLGNRSRQSHAPRQAVRTRPRFDNAVLCVNADQMVELDAMLGLGQFGGRRAGLWFWELADFPKHFQSAIDLVDEVWVASEFNRAAIQAVTDKLVRIVKLPMDLPGTATSWTRRSVGLPDDKFVFLTNFDYLSVHRRKNPIGSIQAYRRAFGPDDGAVLIVKSINRSQRRLDAEEVFASADGRPDIVLIDEYVPAYTMKAMIELSDAYVSLHRSEGYGLNMADAMARRTPVVATGYSGNMDFMTSDTAELIGYRMVEVGPGCGPYDRSALWADPDLDAAAAAMRQLFDDPDRGRELADRAASHVYTEFAADRLAAATSATLLATLDSRKVDN